QAINKSIHEAELADDPDGIPTEGGIEATELEPEEQEMWRAKMVGPLRGRRKRRAEMVGKKASLVDGRVKVVITEPKQGWISHRDFGLGAAHRQTMNKGTALWITDMFGRDLFLDTRVLMYIDNTRGSISVWSPYIMHIYNTR
ncbi:hypothetical protein AMTR_s00029p00164860, partial [Amborella trichopoda]